MYVYISLWSRYDVYIYKSDLVLAIAQIGETRLDLQKFLPANTSVIFMFSYVPHYISFCVAGITDFLLKVLIHYKSILVEKTKMNLFAVH